MTDIAQHSDTVTIHYVASTRDGGVVEDTTNRHPLQFNLQDDRYHLALREQIIGMAPGETKSIYLDPEQCYGLRDHNRQLTVPANCLPEGIHKGDQIAVNLDDAELNVWIIDIDQNHVTVDCNHPLAGEALEMTIQLLEVIPQTDPA